ncbi:MAG: PmoA family protein [Verrucomicrobiota bacterium]|nr:PmoA family protein [Verrucomicrobiota bacterium]
MMITMHVSSFFFRNVVNGALAVAVSLLVGMDTRAGEKSFKGVLIAPHEGKLRIEINGDFFTEYHYQEVSRPFFYPVMGADGMPMTRNWPMAEGKGEAHDHPHHKSFWYAHGDINGHDFWSESDAAGITRHVAFLRITSGRKMGVIRTLNHLVAKDGSVVGSDVRTMTIHNRPSSERIVDFEIEIRASHGEIVMGDTKEGSMALRLAPTMRLEGKVAQGHIENSEGIKDGDTWGKRAKWVDYYGPVNGQKVGVAIFDHPENPRHPTWWHVRSYGLFAANPFGVHHFERKESGTGNLTIKRKESMSWKYRFFFHQGDTESGKVASRYDLYSRE